MTRSEFLSSRRVRLAVLTLGHFLVDMYGGFVLSLIPVLYGRLDVKLSTMTTLAGICGIVVNGVQPLAGMALSRIGGRPLLIVGVSLAAFTAAMGLLVNFWAFAALVLVTRVGIGMFHPAGLVATQSLSVSKEHLSVPVFISAGYFGWSMGAVIATQWVTRFSIESLWVSAAPAVVIVGLLAVTNPRRKADDAAAHEHEKVQSDRADGVNFYLLLVLAIIMVSGVLVPYTFLNVDLAARFGPSGLRCGGIVLGMIGLCGVLGSYLWGYMSTRVSPFVLIACAQAWAAATYPFMIRSDGWAMVALGGVAGLCMGGALFPLLVTISRQSPQLTRGLRAGLIIGGTWGIASLAPMACGFLTDWGVSAATILAWAEAPIIVTVGLAVAIQLTRREPDGLRASN